MRPSVEVPVDPGPHLRHRLSRILCHRDAAQRVLFEQVVRDIEQVRDAQTVRIDASEETGASEVGGVVDVPLGETEGSRVGRSE